MPRNEVAVLIQDPKKLFHALELLKRLNLSFCVHGPENIDSIAARVLLSAEGERHLSHDQRLVLLDDSSADRTAIQILLKLMDVADPKYWAIGVDPGMRFGLALATDGLVVLRRTASSPSEAVNFTAEWARHVDGLFPGGHLVIRLGSGSRLYSVLYLRRLAEIGSELRIELVDEHHTTISGGSLSDESSAVMIAARRGRPIVESDMKLDVREGDVRSLKRLYHRLTRGKRRLSSQEAHALIRGETTLADLLKMAE